MDDTTKPKRSALMRFLRKLPKGKNRRHRKLGAFANTRQRRMDFIASSQRQAIEIARKRREARHVPEELVIEMNSGRTA